MDLKLRTIGHNPPQWVEEGFAHYARRLKTPWRMSLRDLPAAKRGPTGSRAIWQESEALSLLKGLKPTTFLIALDGRGQAFSTEQLAQHIERITHQSSECCLIIGGPDGLAPRCLARANLIWSLSPLTLPHGLVRIVVAEQIYRAWSLLNHHPYHRAD